MITKFIVAQRNLPHSDALAVAKFLKRTDESAYHYLTRVPITFHRKQKAFESIHHSPIIRVDENDVRAFSLSFEATA